jgi:lipid-A-disaccharide synthase
MPPHNPVNNPAEHASSVPTALEKSVVIVAGEASGDAHAARLVHELKKLQPGVRVRGMGGENLRREGVDVFIDMARLAVVGLVEVLMNYRMIKGELNKLKRDIRDNPPDLLILVDYQEFNQQLAAYARSIGVKVLFYIGPQVWAWRPKRIYKIARIVDHMAVILPFEKQLYEKADVPVTFTGHPLTDEVIRNKSRQQARAELNIDDVITIGLFPGSRNSEIKRLLPILLETAKRIRREREQKQQADVQFILPLASTIDSEDLSQYQDTFDELGIITTNQPFYDVIQSCDAIVSTSGTAVLEIGLLEVPMVIINKVAALSYFILSRMVHVEYIGLVNIIMGRPVAKEFIQSQATPENISREIQHLLEDEEYYAKIQQDLRLMRKRLGDGNGSRNVAELAYKMLNEIT